MLKPFGIIGCALAIFGGCPKRQVTPRIVYIPAAPSAAEPAGSKSTQAIVIEAPPPPEPSQAVEELPASAPEEETHARRHPVRRQAPPPAEHTEPAPPVPALEPSQSQAQAAAQRNSVVGLQQQLQRRISQLSRAGLSGTDLRTLDGARAFLAQSVRALQDSDVQGAENLAHKAELLLQAIEQSQ